MNRLGVVGPQSVRRETDRGQKLKPRFDVFQKAARIVLFSKGKKTVSWDVLIGGENDHLKKDSY